MLESNFTMKIDNLDVSRCLHLDLYPKLLNVSMTYIMLFISKFIKEWCHYLETIFVVHFGKI